MIKVVAGVFKEGNKILLMRRDVKQKHAGQWEYPGGKVQEGEKLSIALKRELNEELSINAKIGDMITSVRRDDFEIYAFHVLSYTGQIQLRVHDKMEWVDMDRLIDHPQLPADKEISKKIAKTKEDPYLEWKARIFAYQNISFPMFDVTTQLWIVNFTGRGKIETQTLKTQSAAMEFFANKSNEFVNMFISCKNGKRR